MEFYEVDQVWQLYLVYHIRAQIRKSMKDDDLDTSLVSEFNEDFGKENHYVLLADGETGIGTMRINYISDKIAKIERVAVNPDYQHQGLGSQLLKYTENLLQAKGIENIIINAYEPALNFYLNNDYVIDDDYIIDEPVPQIRVVKKLPTLVSTWK